MFQRLDPQWVHSELIPFLSNVWNPPSPGIEAPDWEREVANAENRINTIRNYDDNIINIDRIRLRMLCSQDLDAEDYAQTEAVVHDFPLVVTMFVRRAINAGPFPLFSLGTGKMPQAVREREFIAQRGFNLPWMIKPNKHKHRQGGNNRGQNRYTNNHRHNQAIPTGFEGITHLATTYNQASPYNVAPLWQSGYDYNYAKYGSDQIHVPVATSMEYPAYTATATAAAPYHLEGQAPQVQSAGHQRQLTSEAPVFVPGAATHQTLRPAPEFVPGAHEHATSVMGGSASW